ncbi:hypothetical protein [Mycoplana ramosa]|uniref:DUF1127 domain-containing protein n=1 Tax=Mycoplana ramosa TaxID=40837 RepID=A0ABW3YU29_MYCRA
MTAGKSHANAAPFALRAVGKGFSLTIRQYLDARAARRRQRQSEYEIANLPPELQRDIGWPEARYSHDKN